MLDIGLYFMYALMLIAVLSAVGLSLMNSIKNPSAFAKAAGGIVGLVILFLICYGISDSTVKPAWQIAGVGPNGVKLIGGGLLTFYIVLVISVLGLIYSEINKALK